MRVCICTHTHTAVKRNLIEMKLLSVLAWNIKILVNKIFVNILVVGEMSPSLSPFLPSFSLLILLFLSLPPRPYFFSLSLYLFIFFFQQQLVFVSRLLLLLWMKRLLIHEKDFLNNEGGVNKARDRLSSWHLILVTFFPRWQKISLNLPT